MLLNQMGLNQKNEQQSLFKNEYGAAIGTTIAMGSIYRFIGGDIGLSFKKNAAKDTVKSLKKLIGTGSLFDRINNVYYKLGEFTGDVAYTAGGGVLTGLSKTASFLGTGVSKVGEKIIDVASKTRMFKGKYPSGASGAAKKAAQSVAKEGVKDAVKAVGMGKFGKTLVGVALAAGIITGITKIKSALDETYREHNVIPPSNKAGQRIYGPGYETAATKYSLDQNMQNKGLDPLTKSTEGLPLAMYSLRHRGYL